MFGETKNAVAFCLMVVALNVRLVASFERALAKIAVSRRRPDLASSTTG